MGRDASSTAMQEEDEYNTSDFDSEVATSNESASESPSPRSKPDLPIEPQPNSNPQPPSPSTPPKLSHQKTSPPNSATDRNSKNQDPHLDQDHHQIRQFSRAPSNLMRASFSAPVEGKEPLVDSDTTAERGTCIEAKVTQAQVEPAGKAVDAAEACGFKAWLSPFAQSATLEEAFGFLLRAADDTEVNEELVDAGIIQAFARCRLFQHERWSKEVFCVCLQLAAEEDFDFATFDSAVVAESIAQAFTRAQKAYEQQFWVVAAELLLLLSERSVSKKRLMQDEVLLACAKVLRKQCRKLNVQIVSYLCNAFYQLLGRGAESKQKSHLSELLFSQGVLNTFDMLLGKVDGYVSVEQDVCTAFLSVMLNRKNFGEDYLSCYKRVESNLTQYYTITRIHSLIAKVSKKASRYRPSMSLTRVSRLELSKAVKSHQNHGRPSTHRISVRKSSLGNHDKSRHRSSRSLLPFRESPGPVVRETVTSPEVQIPIHVSQTSAETLKESAQAVSTEAQLPGFKIEDYPQYFAKKSPDQLCKEVATRCAKDTTEAQKPRCSTLSSSPDTQLESGLPLKHNGPLAEAPQRRASSYQRKPSIKKKMMYDARLIDRAVSSIAPDFDVPARLSPQAWARGRMKCKTKGHAAKNKVKAKFKAKATEKKGPEHVRPSRRRRSTPTTPAEKQLNLVPSAFDISMDDLLAEMDEVAEAEKSWKSNSTKKENGDNDNQGPEEEEEAKEEDVAEQPAGRKRGKKRKTRCNRRSRRRRRRKSKRAKAKRKKRYHSRSNFADKLKRMIEETQSKLLDPSEIPQRAQSIHGKAKPKKRLSEWKRRQRPASASKAAVRIQARFRGNHTRQILEFGSEKELIAPRTLKEDLALLQSRGKPGLPLRPRTARPKHSAWEGAKPTDIAREANEDCSLADENGDESASQCSSSVEVEIMSKDGEVYPDEPSSQGIIKAQASIRRIKQRNEYTDKRNKVIRMQKVYRGHRERRKLHYSSKLSGTDTKPAEDSAAVSTNATKVQARFRAYHQRRKYREHQQSARVLQATVRGHAARKKKQRRHEEMSTVKIQAYWRGKFVRKRRDSGAANP